MKISIKSQTGKTEERVINLASITAGRSRSCDLFIENEALSRKHAQIVLENSDFYITDLGSANGVFIDGNKIPPHTKTKFSSYQIILMGSLEFQFFDTDEVAPLLTDSASKNEYTSSLPTRKIDRVKSSTPPFSSPPLQQDKPPWGLYFSAALVVAVIFGFYKSATDDNDEFPIVHISKNNRPQELKPEIPRAPLAAAPEEFLEKTIYLQRGEKRSCQSFETLCQDLLLKDKDGITKVMNEYFIYVDPTHYLDQGAFNTLAEAPLARDAAAIYQILKNPITEELGNKTQQIHLILMNKEGDNFRVYRFHPNTLKQERLNIIVSIGKGVQSGKLEASMEYLAPFIPSKDF